MKTTDWISAMSSLLTFVLALCVYLNWRKDEFISRQMKLMSDLLDKTSEYFLEIREGNDSDNKAKLEEYFQYVMRDKSHYIKPKLIRAIGRMTLSATLLRNKRASGQFTENDGLEFYNSVMDFKSLLAYEVLPFCQWIQFKWRMRNERKTRELFTDGPSVH